MSTTGDVVEAVSRHGENKRLAELGREMSRFKTELGFPPDIFMAEVLKRRPLSKSQQIYVLFVYMDAQVQHKRASAATDQAIERTRQQNRVAMLRFIKSGEVGIY